MCGEAWLFVICGWRLQGHGPLKLEVYKVDAIWRLKYFDWACVSCCYKPRGKQAANGLTRTPKLLKPPNNTKLRETSATRKRELSDERGP